MKKVILVANTAWSIFNFRKSLITYLISKGYSVCTIAPFDKFSEKLKELGCHTIDLPISAKGLNPFVDLKLIYQLFRIYKAEKPAIIFHYTIKPNIYGSVAAFFAKRQSIAITTGLGYTFLNNNLISAIARRLYKFSLTFPKQVWFLNNDDHDVFIQHNLVSASKTMILDGEGVDCDFFTPSTNQIKDGKFRFLLIARMLKDKGIYELVYTAEKFKKLHPNAVFQLLGSCDALNPSAIDAAEIEKWHRAGIVEYLGTTEDVRPFISAADVVVLPSYREGIPRTLIEAASMGKPLITTDTPGCRDVIKPDITGFLCKPRDSDSLFRACEKAYMIKHETLIEMGLMGRQFMQIKFDDKLVIARYADVMKMLDV